MLSLTTKDYQEYKFTFEQGFAWERVQETIHRLAFIMKHKHYFAYDYAKAIDSLDNHDILMVNWEFI